MMSENKNRSDVDQTGTLWRLLLEMGTKTMVMSMILTP